MTTPNRPGLWHRLFGRRDDGDTAEAEPPPPLFPPRKLPPPEPRGPGLPEWDEILSAAPPVPEPVPEPEPPAEAAGPDAPAPAPMPPWSGANPAGPAMRLPTEEERRVLTQVAALLGSGQIPQAAALLDAVFRERPEACDTLGRPIYLLESLHCALLLGAADAAAERATRLRDYLKPDDPVVEMLYARAAIAAGDRAAARANWQAALARAPALEEARAWLAAHPTSPDGGVPALDLLGEAGTTLAWRIQPPPSLAAPPAEPVAIPEWLPGLLHGDAAVWVGEDGTARVASAADMPAARAVPRAAEDDLALVFHHPDGIGQIQAFTEVLHAAFVLQRQFLGHLRPARLYAGRQPWAMPGPASSTAAQLEMLATLFPGIRVIGEHDGAWREANVLVVDGARRNAATGTLIGAMMPQVVQWTAEARARAHAACGLPDLATPPRTAGRRPRLLYLNAPPPRTLAEPVRERLFALFAGAGFDVASADMASLPWHEQVRLAYGADIITGAHGPQMDAVLWAHPQTRVLELFPEGMRRYDGQLLAEAAGLIYLGLEGVADGGFVSHARDRWGPPIGRGNRMVWALPWALLEQAVTPAGRSG